MNGWPIDLEPCAFNGRLGIREVYSGGMHISVARQAVGLYADLVNGCMAATGQPHRGERKRSGPMNGSATCHQQNDASPTRGV